MSAETHSTVKRIEARSTFYKNWYVKLNDSTHRKALWLRFTLLSSQNGFKRIAEVWAIFFQRLPNQEVKKVALKQTHDIQSFLASEGSSIRIANCELLMNQTRGSVQSKGKSIRWDLHLLSTRESSIRFVPDILSKTKIVKNSIVTLCEELLFSGTCEVNGETFRWHESPGMQGYLDGPKNSHSWVWGHCNSFINEQGSHDPFLFEGLSTRSQVGPLVIPKLSSFYFFYRNQHFHFNTLRDAFSIKSKNDLNEWQFQADREELSFRGTIRAEHKEFAGLTFEDTNGSLLYCTHSELASMTLHVYRRGKLESTLTAIGTVGFELVSREKNPYVPLIV